MLQKNYKILKKRRNLALVINPNPWFEDSYRKKKKVLQTCFLIILLFIIFFCLYTKQNVIYCY